MKILVTGANGQLGCELRAILSFTPHEVVYADRHILDLANAEAIQTFFSENIFDVVVNCAAYTAVDKAESDTTNANLVNAMAPGLIAGYCKSNGTKLIHISTDFVFDGNASVPYKETDTTHPISVYGNTKLEGEKNVLHLNADAIIIRTGWLYSQFGHNFFKTMLRLCKEKEQLGVVFDQIGTPTYAADLAQAIVNIMGAKTWAPGIYHYSNEGVASWYDFAHSINRIAGYTCQVIPIQTHQYPTPAKRPPYSVLNKIKIKDTYSLQIPHWQDSLFNCMQKIKTEL